MTTQVRRAPLAGVTVARIGNPFWTPQQLDGEGNVYNQVLAVTSHIGGALNSLEFVNIPPAENGVASSVGEHEQGTDEIYFVVEGTGILTTNGIPHKVSPGFLAIAPRGTKHSICNLSMQDWLRFLVMELKTPDELVTHQPAHIEGLLSAMQESDAFHPAEVGQQSIPLEVASVDLSGYFASPFGLLRVVRIPVGARVGPYQEPDHDENLLSVEGFAQVRLGADLCITSGHERLNVFVPREVTRMIVNPSSKDPLTILSLLVRHV